ncbi:MAG: ArnT family glycosyltransferase [Chthoniobacterales bacterium]
MLWIILSLLTAGRLLFAATGCLSGPESYLMLCGERLDWGFVEGPAGVPALIRFSTALGGFSSFGVRLLAPCLLLLSSFVLWWLVRNLRGKKVAFWSVLAFNLLPLTNAEALVMDGAMVVATFWIMTIAWSWFLIVSKKRDLLSWVCFGLLLGITTQVSYAVGWLLPVVIAIMIVRRQGIPWLAVVPAVLLFALGWVGPLWWNAHHDWLQWANITWGSFWSYHLPSWRLTPESSWCWLLLSLPLMVGGIGASLFCSSKKKRGNDLFYFLILLVVPLLFFLGGIGHDNPSFGLQLVLLATLLPGSVDFFLKTDWRKKSGLVLLCATGGFSVLLVFYFFNQSTGDESPWSIPSPRGVEGVQKVALEVLRLRALKTDPSQESSSSPTPPFIIAETPELAALLGAVLSIHYPELEGAPSVFTPESPSFSSQFQLWPHYADAVAAGVVDPLYTEEPKTSPFLGHDAIYITTESEQDLPETISGAFSTVVSVSEATLQRGKRSERLIIYQCNNYQMMSL